MRSTLSLFAGLACAASTLAQAPNVVGVEPAANLVGALHRAPVVVHFDQPIALTSLNSTTFRVFGRWSGPTSGAYFLQNGGTTAVFTPTESYSAGEEVWVQVTTGVTHADGTPIARGWTTKFWVEAMPASLDFGTPATFTTQYPTSASTRPYGGYGGDLDDDGYPDLSVVCEDTNDLRVYLNDGQGGFPNPPTMQVVGGTPSPSEGGDFDGDGLLDVTVTGAGVVAVFLNAGGGALAAPTIYSGPVNAHGMAVLDYDGDGDEDIAVTDIAGAVVFLRNDGTGSFTAGGGTTAASGAWGLDAADMNGDGIDDLIVGGGSQMQVLLGDGTGGFSVGGSTPTGHAWQLTCGDLDGDGNLDVIGASTGGDLHFAFGDGTGALGGAFSQNAGFFTVAADLGDLDGDGDLDAISSDFGAGIWSVYENLGGGSFAAPFTLNAPSNASCAIAADFDGDGRLEVAGFDEISDDILIWDLANGDVQGCANSACLRVNGSSTTGLGGDPLLPLATGSNVTFEVTGSTGQLFGVYYAFAPIPTGFATKWGTLNLNLAGFPPLVLGVTGPPPTPFSAVGVGAITLPANLPVGLDVWTQGFVTHVGAISTGLHLTNPVGSTIVP